MGSNYFYETIPVTDESKRDFKLIIENELAFRDNLPAEQDARSITLLEDAKAMIVAKPHYAMLDAIKQSSHKHFSPGAPALRIAMNALQLVMEGMVILGYDFSDTRKQYQESGIKEFDCQTDTTPDMVTATFDEAIEALRQHHA